MIRARIDHCKPLNLLHELNGTDLITDAVRYSPAATTSQHNRRDEAVTLSQLVASLGRVSHLHRTVLLCDLLPQVLPIACNKNADAYTQRAMQMKMTQIMALAAELAPKLDPLPYKYQLEIIARECGEARLLWAAGNPLQTYAETYRIYGVKEHAQRRARRIVRDQMHAWLLAAGQEWEKLYLTEGKPK